MKLLSTILIAFGAAIHGSWGLRFTMDCCGTSGHTGAVETADGGSGTKEVVLVTDAASEEEDTINPAPEEKEGEPESKEEETEGSKASDAEGTEETPKTPAEKTPAGDEGEGAKPSEGAAASGDEEAPTQPPSPPAVEKGCCGCFGGRSSSKVSSESASDGDC